MSNTTTISLFQNTWNYFQQLHEALDTVLDEKGEKQLSVDKLSGLESKIQLKKSAEILTYFQYVNKFLGNIDPSEFNAIPLALFAELKRIHDEVATFLGVIRTIRARYKTPSVGEKIMTDLGRVNSACSELINQIFTLWVNHSWNEEEEEPLQLEATPSYKNLVNLWFESVSLNEMTYSVVIRPEEWWKNIAEWLTIKETIENLYRFNKTTTVFIKEIFQDEKLQNHEIFKQDDLRKEMLCYFAQYHLLNEHESPLKKDKQKSKDIQNKFVNLFEELFKTYCIDLGAKYDLIVNPEEPALKILPGMIISKIENLENDLEAQYEGDLQLASQELGKRLSPIYALLDELEEWFNTVKEYLEPWDKVILRFQNAITHSRDDVERTVNDFESYSNTVREESFRTDLNQIIDAKIADLETLLHQYESETSQLIENNFPEIQKMQEMLNKYESQVLKLKESMKSEFQKYREKDIDMYPSIKLWNEKYEELKNRIRFTIVNLITTFVKKFQIVFSDEQTFIKKLGDLSTEEDELPSAFTSTLLQPERMTEKELRDRINAVNEKLLELEGQQHYLEEEKQKFQEYLGKVLKTTRNLETKQCVICHKPVDVTNDHFIQCEFCKSLSHYSCAAWWINKYNSCPVCHNSYTVPNSDVYDPDAVNQE